MSWASHNPEAYDDILTDGIKDRIAKALRDSGFDGLDPSTVDAVVEAIYQEDSDSKVFNALVDWSQHEIVNAEADYFGSIADSRG